MVQWTVFLISYWGAQIGQKVKKICDWWVMFLHQVVGFKRSLDFKMSKYLEPDYYICINSWTFSCEDQDESFGFLFFLASTHRRLPTQRAQLSERRFCGDFRAESKISNQYVSMQNHRVVLHS